MKRRFPGAPEIDSTNPFEDGNGVNPFGDGASKPLSREDPYGGPADSRSQTYRPDDFEAVYPSRGRVVVTFGICGIVLVTIGVAVSVVAVLRTPEWSAGLAYGVPFNLLGVCLSVPGWVIGRQDLRSMRAGAMQTIGRRATRVGYLLGIAGVIVGAAPIAGYIVALIAESFS